MTDKLQKIFKTDFDTTGEIQARIKQRLHAKPVYINRTKFVFSSAIICACVLVMAIVLTPGKKHTGTFLDANAVYKYNYVYYIALENEERDKNMLIVNDRNNYLYYKGENI